jgi:beta-barrel assembly-enhancing protease
MQRLFVSLALVALILAGCKTLDEISAVGTSVGVATGAITEEEAQSINRTTEAVGKTFDAITPEQEYYIGRTVAATLLSSNPPYDSRAANEYLNVLGQYLALCSDRPETFGGYHFLIMDADEINAFAAPGGLILLSRGLLRCCASEAQVAAVLAHEVGHVQFKHGLQAISKSRLTSALTVLAAESAKNLGGKDVAELAKTFEGSISDITSTLVNSGYSRYFEQQADGAAVVILERAGYDPRALVGVLTTMATRLRPGSGGFAKTHPDPRIRVDYVVKQIGAAAAAPPATAARQARFERALRGI